MSEVAIWGAGGIANTHAAALKANGIPVGLVVNHNVDTAKEFAEKWGIPKWSADPNALLETNISVVHVCTPPGLHYEMVKFLLEHDKHVLCEKPLCLDLAQADELTALAHEKNLNCAVNFNVRFHPACQEVKARIQQKVFGDIRLIHGTYLQEFHALPAPYGWRYQEPLGGTMRAVTEIGSHWLDLAEYLSGKRIVGLQALFGSFQEQRVLKDGFMYEPQGDESQCLKVSSEDSALIQFRMENGAIGSVVLSEVSHGRTNHLTMEITGANQTIWWDSEHNTALHDAEKGSGVHTTLYPFGTNGFNDTFAALQANYYAALNMTRPFNQAGFPTLEDGRRLVLLCQAVQQSAQGGGIWVAV